MQPTTRFSLELATLCGALALAPLAGCDAPDKNVGQETEGGSDTEGGSSGASSLTPGESDSNGSQSSTTDATDSGPSETESDTGPDTDGPTGCEAQTNQSDCEAMSCGWADTRNVTASDDTCGFADGESFCFTYPDDADCAETPACGDGPGYWYQETAAGEWSVIEVAGCTIIPGYQPCTYDGESPAACDCVCDAEPTGASLPPGWEDTLTPAGCSDMTVYAANEADTISLSVALNQGLAAAASTSQETFQGDFDVAEFDRFSVLVGENVSVNECNDVLIREEQIDEEWLAESGSVSLTLVPEKDNGGFGDGGRATLVFTDVVVAYGGSTYTIEDLTFEDVYVGWYPG